MSVKGKVKRLNREIERLNKRVFELEMKNRNLERIKEDYIAEEQKFKVYENIVKFAVTNHIGGLQGGMRIEKCGIDKMNHLRMNVEDDYFMNSYVIRVHY